MHSLIYELKNRAEDANDLYELYINEDNMHRYDIDYVTDLDEEERKTSMRKLQICYNDSMQINMDTGALRFTDVNKMMMPSFLSFQNAAALLDNMTIEDFSGIHTESTGPGSIKYLMYKLEEAYADKGGFHIYHNGQFEPINEFVRNYEGDILSETFYIGNVLDYHY